SAQNDRTAARLSGPGFIVTTRKIAARVSSADTGCGTAIAPISERFSELAFAEIIRSPSIKIKTPAALRFHYLPTHFVPLVLFSGRSPERVVRSSLPVAETCTEAEIGKTVPTSLP